MSTLVKALARLVASLSVVGMAFSAGMETNTVAGPTPGIKACEQERLDEAISRFSAELARAPFDIPLLLKRGNAYAEIGDFSKAISDLDLAITHAVGNPELHYAKAFVLAEAGDRAAAIASYNRAIELNPDYQAALLNRAWLHRKAGRMTKAIGDYERLIQLAPTSTLYRFARAALFIETGRLESAIKDHEVVLRLEPDNAKASSERGDVYHLLGRDREAIRDYEASIRAGSQGAAVHNNLAALLIKRPRADRKDIERAVELGHIALQRAKGDAHRRAIYDTLAKAYKSLGDIKTSEDYAALAAGHSSPNSRGCDNEE